MLGAGPELYNNMEAPDNLVGTGGGLGPEHYNNMEAPENTAVGGSTMLGAGPEYYNNIDAPNNCVGGSESQCARPFLFAQQDWPRTSNLIRISVAAAFPGYTWVFLRV